MKYHPKTKYIASGTQKINKLIKEGNIKLASKLIEELLPKSPKNKYLRYQLAYINFLNNKYEEALEQLEELDEEKNLILKTELYIKLQKEQEQFYMYQKYFSNITENEIIEKNKYRRYIYLYIYLNKKYNPNFMISNNIILSPIEKQIYEYDREKAINSIIKNHQNYSNIENGKFYSNINIEDLYNFALENIKNNNLEGILKYGVENYQFLYPNCGILRSKNIANGFTVVTTLGTKEIITIYPNKIREVGNIIEYVPKNNKKTRRLVKVKSGLERFNSKYNNNKDID